MSGTTGRIGRYGKVHDRSVHPILEPQAGNPFEVATIRCEQERVVCGDLSIGGTDVDAVELFVQIGGGFIEKHNFECREEREKPR